MVYVAPSQMGIVDLKSVHFHSTTGEIPGGIFLPGKM